MIRSYNPGLIQEDGKPYAPFKVQFLVGDSPTDYNFASKEYEYSEDSLSIQTFNIEPCVAIGKFIKVLLIGKRRT